MTLKSKITTKTGDKGFSHLFSGEHVPKSHLRLEAFGNIDELVSVLGLARFYAIKPRIKEELLNLQRDLFVVASELATTEEKLNKLPKRIDEAFVSQFEERHQSLYDATPIPNDFIIPGESLSSGYLDLARTVCRRAERAIVRLFESKEMTNAHVLVWINRVSDYIYFMARFEEEKPKLVKER